MYNARAQIVVNRREPVKSLLRRKRQPMHRHLSTPDSYLDRQA